MLARMSAWASSSRWSRLDFTIETEPSGLVSVMPQPWVTGMPILAPEALREGPGHRRAAAHEGTEAREVVAVDGVEQTHPDGGHTRRHGDLLALQQPQQSAGERSGPGMIRSAPVATHTWGRPQALTWNIGTTGRMRSRSEQASMSALVEAKACSHDDRWL